MDSHWRLARIVWIDQRHVRCVTRTLRGPHAFHDSAWRSTLMHNPKVQGCYLLIIQWAGIDRTPLCKAALKSVLLAIQRQLEGTVEDFLSCNFANMLTTRTAHYDPYPPEPPQTPLDSCSWQSWRPGTLRSEHASKETCLKRCNSMRLFEGTQKNQQNRTNLTEVSKFQWEMLRRRALLLPNGLELWEWWAPKTFTDNGHLRCSWSRRTGVLHYLAVLWFSTCTGLETLD